MRFRVTMKISGVFNYTHDKLCNKTPFAGYQLNV